MQYAGLTGNIKRCIGNGSVSSSGFNAILGSRAMFLMQDPLIISHFYTFSQFQELLGERYYMVLASSASSIDFAEA
jgi:hypothetical protein